jgi:hypothetical protein
LTACHDGGCHVRRRWHSASPVWTASGPKTPTTIGKYLVFIQAQGSPKPADCLGWLVVY